ncbi:MAG: DUF1694 domain-containing protein [Bacillota bacterium]|nr:DUF1694 domain-containing protein [Bacillota bacterium]
MKKLSDMSNLDKALLTGIHGDVVIKKEERIKYLGELKENVILALTFDEMAKSRIDTRISEAINHPNFGCIIISGKIALRDWAYKYRKLAKDKNLPCRVVTDPDHMGDIGLVVAQKKS